MTKCPRCNGIGKYEVGTFALAGDKCFCDKCDECNGTGYKNIPSAYDPNAVRKIIKRKRKTK